jgi:V/A-type H+/Na+-transporting ATPase subunit I
MRKEVRKYLFVGAIEDKERFFLAAQAAGVIEFIDTANRGGLPVPQEIATILTAKKILRRLEPVPQEELPDLQAADFIAARVVELDAQLERLAEEKRVVNQEFFRVLGFGNFSLEDLDFIQKHSGRVVQFYFCRKGHVLGPEAQAALIPVGSAFDLDYYIGFNEERTQYPGVSETHVDQPAGTLRKRLSQIEEEIHHTEAELKTFANRREFLQHALIERLNDYHYSQAESFSLSAVRNSLFAVEGWVPLHLLPRVHEVARDLSVHVEEIAIEATDRVPTYLENRRLARVGEDLVHVYDSPSIQDRDPSRWVLWFFAFFFGIIVGDAGYGLILLAIAGALIPRVWKRSERGRRFLTLMLVLGGACLIWGFLTTSWFGIPIGPKNPLRDVSLVDYLVRKKVEYVIRTKGATYEEWVKTFPQLAHVDTVEGWLETGVKMREGRLEYYLLDRFSNNILMEIALFVGAIHIILAFLRVIDRNWAGVGWILFIIGGYLYFAKIVHATSLVNFLFGVSPAVATSVGFELLWIGLGLAVVLALIQHRLRGAGEIVNVVQVFSDVLSYLRLYALGLAGVMMSTTFNGLASSAGIVAGILILIVGHAVNISLSMGSGVIHGLRLNYLEWYRHCFEGGGRMLRPLKRIQIS